MDFQNDFFDSDLDDENEDKSSQSSSQYESNLKNKNDSNNAGNIGYKKHDWFLLKEFDNETAALDCLKLKMPYSITRNSACNTFCKLKIETRMQKHKLKLSHKRCKGHKIDEGHSHTGDSQYKSCPVQYKFVQCNICSIYQIFQYGKHSINCLDIIEDGTDEIHPEAQVFGIHPRVKLIIQNLLVKNPTYYTPQQISLYLNQKHIKDTLMKGLIIPDKESISHFLRSFAKNPSKLLALKDEMLESEIFLENDQIEDYELDNATASFTADLNENENHSLKNGNEDSISGNKDIQCQSKVNTSVNTGKNENETLDFGLFESFNIFFIKLKDETKQFNYLCFLMLKKEMKSIGLVKQLETLNMGKLNFFTKELIYIYGLPNEIRYSDNCLCSAFQEINCNKKEMTDSEKSVWVNSVNSYFEENYSQFDILNFSSTWNQKGISLKSIIYKLGYVQTQNNSEILKKNPEKNNDTLDDDNLNVKKRKLNENNPNTSKNKTLSEKTNEKSTIQEIETLSQNRKNKNYSNKTELRQYEALKRIHEDEIRHHEKEIQRHLDSIKRHRFYQDELEKKYFYNNNSSDSD